MLTATYLFSRAFDAKDPCAWYYQDVVRRKSRGNDRQAAKDMALQERAPTYPKLVAYAPTNRRMRRAHGGWYATRLLRASVALERRLRDAGDLEGASRQNARTCQLERLRPAAPGSRRLEPGTERHASRVRRERAEREAYLADLVRPFSLPEQLDMRAQVKALGWKRFAAMYQPFVNFTPAKPSSFEKTKV